MAIFKGIDKSETSLNEIEVYKTFSLDQDSDGINSIQFRSGSLQTDERTPTVSGSYWDSLLINFYLSGSSRSIGEKKYNFMGYSFGSQDTKNPQHRNKFHSYSSSSIITIPQKYFGEKIKKNRKQIYFTSNTYISPKNIILDTNGTAVARHGLILSQNAATGSRKVFD